MTLTAELADARRQLHAKSTNQSQALEAEYLTQIEALQSTLEGMRRAASKSKGDVRRAIEGETIATSRADNFMTDAISFQVMMGGKGELRNAEERLARRDKMITARDVSKLEKDALIKSLRSQLTSAGEETAQLRTDLAVSVCAAAQSATALATSEKVLTKLKATVATRAATAHRSAGMLGGRPLTSRTDEELESMETQTALKWSKAATDRLLDAIGEVGTETETSLQVIIDGLRLGGYFEMVWNSAEMWTLRMEWAREMRATIQATWTPELTRRLRDKINLSYDEVDELRFAFSHNRVGKQLRPRPWMINPHDGKRINFPEPLAPRATWTPLIKTFIEDHGLERDGDGKIAQRSYCRVLREQVGRDVQRGWLKLDALTKEEPLRPTLQADGTAVGKVGFMHVGSDISSNYTPGVAQQNEVNVCTIAAAQTDDHWGGLDEVLCGGYYSGKV